MKPFSAIAVVVFVLVALAQLLRLVLGWPVVVNGINIPLWVSAIACLVAAELAGDGVGGKRANEVAAAHINRYALEGGMG